VNHEWLMDNAGPIIRWRTASELLPDIAYINWNPHFKDGATLILRRELLTHFPGGLRSSWAQESLRFLDGFRTPEGHYHFPGEYLREAEGYYVSGYGMGLGENRCKPAGIEIESTFRMLKIKSQEN